MNKKDVMEKYKLHVEWMRNNIPPDDIYDFTEQVLMGSVYFFYQCYKHNVINLEDPITMKWAKNIAIVVTAQEANERCEYDLALDDLYDFD